MVLHSFALLTGQLYIMYTLSDNYFEMGTLVINILKSSRFKRNILYSLSIYIVLFVLFTFHHCGKHVLNVVGNHQNILLILET